MSAYPSGYTSETPKKKNTPLIIVIILVVVSCLCLAAALCAGIALYLWQNMDLGDLSQVLPAPEDLATPSAPQPVEPEKPLLEMPDLFGAQLGDEIREDTCGFSFRPVPLYQLTDFGCLTGMAAPGAGDAGPYINVLGGTTKEPVDDEYMRTNLKTKLSVSYTGEKKIKVDGIEGISYDFEGTVDGVAVKGRTAGVVVNSMQIFSIDAAAPVDQWEEVEAYYKGVLNSVRFFTPAPTPRP